MKRMISWLSRCIWIVLLLFGAYGILYFIDQSSWELGGWNDRVFERIQSTVPEGWFVDQFVFFDTYELNVLITAIGLGGLLGILYDFVYSVLLNNKEELSDDGNIRG